jgi:uncharacterized protein
MFYIDTSVVVASLTSETSTSVAQLWLAKHANESLVTSAWVKAETFSALAMKRRQGEISDAVHAAAKNEFIHMMRGSFIHYGISLNHFEMAAEYVSKRNINLRAADALHLAIATDNDATLCTLDKGQFDAAKALRIKAVLL